LEYFTDDSLGSIDLEAGREKKVTVSIMHSMVRVWHNLFNFWNYHYDEFIRVENVSVTDDKMNKNTMALVTIRIQMDRWWVYFGVVAENIVTSLEKIGGFASASVYIGFLFVAFFQERLFKSSFFK
jgi:hypothetical protein